MKYNLLEQIEGYVQKNSSIDFDIYNKCKKSAQDKNISMMSDAIQGCFIEIITKLINPKVVLEVGCFVAYSTICFAKAINKNSKIYSLELDTTLKKTIDENLEYAGVENKVEVIYGDAIESIKKFDKEIDLSFIDANKNMYINYYENIYKKTKKGGCILVDNVLWKHKVLEPKKHEDDKTLKSILNFNKRIQEDTRVEKILLPIRDGLFILRKK